jgi:hypothetical protein
MVLTPTQCIVGGDQSPCMLFETEILLYVSKLDWFLLGGTPGSP